MVVVTWSGCEH